MEPAESIGRFGFARWYERQLIEGHAWLVTCFLCMVLVGVLLEDLSASAPFGRLLLEGVIVAVAGLIGIYGWQRYLDLMRVAERYVGRAKCGACGTYARFKVVGCTATSLAVRCRDCGSEWTIR